MKRFETLQEFLDDGWIRIDLYAEDDRPDKDKRIIMTCGRGSLIEVDYDGEWYPLKMATELATNDTRPMFSDTTRGVFGYMSDVTFSYELGQTKVEVWATPEGAGCHKSGGLVKVEVIGVKTLVPMNLNMDDGLIYPNRNDEQPEMDDGA